jgi:acetyl esterase
MPLDPQIADILERVERAGHPPFWQLTPAQARDSYRRAARVLEIAPASVARTDDFSIRARDGYALPLRVYAPRGELPRAGFPLLMFYHGGGFTIGDLETHDAVCRMLCHGADCIVMAVDYRLAPEHPFPSAANDAWDALSWAHAHARRLGADVRRIALAGDSAGGTLATVCALQARAAGITVVLQVLVYPGTAGRQESASHQRLAEGFLLDARTIQWFFGNYIRNDADRDDWRFAPLVASGRPALAGVAPAVILVAGYDPLYDDGLAFAEQLRVAGVEVRVFDYPGMVHGFFNFGGAVTTARQAHADVVGQLRRVFFGEERANGA